MYTGDTAPTPGKPGGKPSIAAQKGARSDDSNSKKTYLAIAIPLALIGKRFGMPCLVFWPVNTGNFCASSNRTRKLVGISVQFEHDLSRYVTEVSSMFET